MMMRIIIMVSSGPRHVATQLVPGRPDDADEDDDDELMLMVVAVVVVGR